MVSGPVCARCGGPLDSAAEGLCLRCLLGFFLASRPDAAPGPVPPAYRILTLLGHGRTGTVYLAEADGVRHRLVVVEILTTARESSAVVAELHRLRDALASLADLSFPRVLDAGVSTGTRPYVVSEYAAGLQLGTFAARLQLTLAERLKLLLQACDALAGAHAHGLVHGSLTGKKMLFSGSSTSPVLKVVDTGIAPVVRLPDESPRAAAADVRALGAILRDLIRAASSSNDDIRLKDLREVAEKAIQAGATTEGHASAAEMANHLRACLL
jgi:serine/threonine protein kinase